MSIHEFVVGALAAQAGCDPTTLISLDQKLSQTGLDSLDLMELLNEVEERFDITVNDDTVTAETTVGDFIAFVETKVTASAG